MEEKKASASSVKVPQPSTGIAPAAAAATPVSREELSRAYLKELVKYFYVQISKGCDRPGCEVPGCAGKASVPASPAQVQIWLKQAIEAANGSGQLCPHVVGPFTYSTLVKLAPPPPQDLNVPDAMLAAAERYVASTFASLESIKKVFIHGMIESNEDPCIDFDDMQRTYSLIQANDKLMKSLTTGVVKSAVPAFVNYVNQLLKSDEHKVDEHFTLRHIVILLSCPIFEDPAKYDSLRLFCDKINLLPYGVQKVLENHFVFVPKQVLERILMALHGYISVQWLKGEEEDSRRAIYKDIAPVVKFMKILFTANKRRRAENALGVEEFYNEIVNESFDCRLDYLTWFHHGNSTFCFINYPFVIQPSHKALLLQIDNSQQMRKEFERAVMSSFFGGGEAEPYLVLEVNRSALIEDSIVQLQMRNSRDLKKPLKVKFIGEAGIDEGGVRKEYFQLLVQQLFDPKFGMFVYNEECHTFWFNKISFESEHQFELIGIVL
eukprot:TRINITY_DN3705_c0_g1_i3.p1 TRINITY_DN3705_c0_g1~~TRINITY_DN3705_c0_g1_i3.p1  ORF type:complete len:493 (-),score=129.22 TRINITY_DN3705_c0_g1_i3:837-2315(-)